MLSSACINLGSYAMLKGPQKYALPKFRHLLCILCRLNVPNLWSLKQKSSDNLLPKFRQGANYWQNVTELFELIFDKDFEQYIQNRTKENGTVQKKVFYNFLAYHYNYSYLVHQHTLLPVLNQVQEHVPVI